LAAPWIRSKQPTRETGIVTEETGNKRHGLTSWIKARLLGRGRTLAPVDAGFISELSDIEEIGRYEVLDRVGKGSMGMVYLGKDPYIKRHVAIKISRPSRDLSDQEADNYRERFFLEAQSAGRLSHPNIVAIYDAGLYRDFCYITMEYVDGPTLERFCRPENLLPIPQVVEIIFAACRALDYAHKMGVVHRDIKPSNIMLNKSGSVKITDFGIARIEAEHTLQDGIIGSPSYMSPEQIKEDPVGEKSDIFSLGCVLYELLTANRAFTGENYFSILYRITHEDPPSLLSYERSIPEVLDKIARKALAKDPSLRYQTCMDLAYDLRVALRGLKGSVKRSKIEDVVDYIHQVPFFEPFSRDQVTEILMASNLVKAPKGRVIVNEGDIDDSFFIILSGQVVVRKDGRTLSRIDRGECFGEMAYLSGKSRAASVVAATNCILMKSSATLLDRSPLEIQLLFLRQFALTLLTRLSKSNSQKV
jgi:eukaryotic-like serine/threonine-protein kinase